MTITSPDPQRVAHEVAGALAEDLGAGDVTAQLIPADATARAHVLCRNAATIAGQPWFDETFRQLDADCRITWYANDGDQVNADTRLCTLQGRARAMLSAERTALNFLQTLSGTATVTAQYAIAVAGTGCAVLDTRKTLPGLRLAQKYAVRCGGGRNHRNGLYDGVLIKENHIAAAGSIAAAVLAARSAGHDLPVEVEVENLDQVHEALTAGADILLLDNFPLDLLREAKSRVLASAPAVKLEASGGIELNTVREVAQTGVDFVSVGALTKHLTATDLSMRFALTLVE